MLIEENGCRTAADLQRENGQSSYLYDTTAKKNPKSECLVHKPMPVAAHEDSSIHRAYGRQTVMDRRSEKSLESWPSWVETPSEFSDVIVLRAVGSMEKHHVMRYSTNIRVYTSVESSTRWI